MRCTGDAIYVAKKNVIVNNSVVFVKETIEDCSPGLDYLDFGYHLGVSQYIAETQEALNDCTKLLKSGAPILLYLQHSFENKLLWFKAVWKLSNYIRKFISISPKPIKHFLANMIALFL